MSDDSKSAAPAVEELSFEQAFNELEGTVRRLEEADLTLDQAIAFYERGMRLAQRCSNALDAAELQVKQVAEVNDQQQLGMFFNNERE